MSLFTHSELRKLGEDVLRNRKSMGKLANFATAANCLAEDNRKAKSELKDFDVFLCHSKLDEQEILGLRDKLTSIGLGVYVDWIDDQQLDRTQVNKNTADTLRQRMRQSKSLFYATSTNASSSAWMPWELGYFDGLKEKVAVLPIADSSSDDSYSGREYCQLYPYIVRNGDSLYVHRDASTYVGLRRWLDGAKI